MAKSYIDAEKLIAEIERRIEANKIGANSAFRNGKIEALRETLEYANSLQQEQPDTKEPSSYLEHWLAFFGCPEENIEKCATQIVQGYGAIRYLEGVQHGAEAVNELAQQEQPMPDSTKLIELWHEDEEMLKEKDFRDDPWRLAYNAFMCGFGRGVAVNRQEQPEVDFEKDIDAFFDKWDKNSNGAIFDENGARVTIETIKGVVKHFLNARKEESKCLTSR